MTTVFLRPLFIHVGNYETTNCRGSRSPAFAMFLQTIITAFLHRYC